MVTRKLKAREKKSIARYHQEFGGTMGIGVVGLLLSMRAFKPIVALVALVCGFQLMSHSGLHMVNGHGIAMAFAAPVLVPEELKEQFTAGIKELKDKLESFNGEAKKEIAAVGKVSDETKEKLDKTLTDIGDFRERIKGIEDKLSKSTVDGGGEARKSLGETVVESEQYKGFVKMGQKASGKIEIAGGFHKTAIVNATGLNQPLVPPVRVPGIIEPLRQRLTIRDLLNVIPTTGNLVEFVKESSSTNAAAPQGAGSSPQVFENVAKAESALAFTLSHEAVQTLAHWIPASRQVLDDAAQLAGYINSRLLYFLKLKEEDQLLNGTGASAQLNGLITQATAYDTGLNVVGDTIIDKLRHVILQVELANADVTGIVLNPQEWHDIELIKTTGTASSGQYIFANPHQIGSPNIWGRNVVPTKSIVNGHVLAGDFAMACDLYDRQQASIEVSRDYSDYFVKNMVAILAEERIALVTYRPEALVYGSF